MTDKSNTAKAESASDKKAAEYLDLWEKHLTLLATKGLPSKGGEAPTG